MVGSLSGERSLGQTARCPQPDTLTNRYSYVHNGPLAATDPSGHIAAEEEEEATTIITQLCDVFGICIEIDFGYVPYESLGPDDPVWMWAKGQWELRQLEALRNTVQYANELYGHYVEGEITALDFLSELTDYRASLGSLETFVDDISTVVLGDRGVQVWWRAPSHCIIRVMPTIDSDGCRPLVLGYADHPFRQHGVQFSQGAGIGGCLGSESVVAMLRNPGRQP